jgi:[ribosomal protein S5]-alanine N-acetyltransferase
MREELCQRIFLDIEEESLPESIERAYTIVPFDSGIEQSWKNVNARISMTGNPEKMKKMLHFEEDAILISSSNDHLELAECAGIATLGLERDIRIFSNYVIQDMDALSPEYIEGVYRRCHELSWDIAETKRLWIRETEEEDLSDLIRIYKDKELLRFLPPMEDYESEYQKLLAYQKNVYGLLEFGIWSIVSKESERVIGKVGFELKDFQGEAVPDLGYVIASEQRRCGYAAEACQAALAWMKEHTEYQKITCRIAEENKASIALAEKLGFKKTEEKEIYLLSEAT